MAVMTRSTNTSEIDAVIEIKQILAQARANFYYAQFGRPDEFRKREGNTVRWWTRSALTAQTATHNDNPTLRNSAITHTPITATVAFYGDDVTTTELLEGTSVVDIPGGVKEEIANGAGLSIDTVVRDTLLAAAATSGITHLFAGGVTSAAITTANTASYSDMQDVATVLQSNKVPMIKHPKTGALVYIAIITPKQKNQMMKDTTFKQMAQYGNQDRYFLGELGVIDNICFVVSSNTTTYTYNSINCEKALVLGKDAYGVSAMPTSTGKSGSVPESSVWFKDNEQWTMDRVNSMFRVIVTPPGNGAGGGAHGDEYAVKTTIAWKAYFAHKILQASFMRVYVSASQLTANFS